MAFRLLFETERESTACLDDLPYDEWLEFVFQHPEPKKNADRWYDLAASEAFYYRDSRQFLKRLTRLKKEADLLLSRYSNAQIAQGFWCFISAFELCDLLEDKGIDLKLRQDCILAVNDLYRRLFRRPGFEKIALHYWDALTYAFFDNTLKLANPDALQIQETMFTTLCKILYHKDRICFFSAMRGLSHLRHELSARAISECLAIRNDLSIHDHVYAISCLRGEVDQVPDPLPT